MMDHLRRFGWLYGLAALAAAWPWALYRLQSAPDLDMRSSDAFFAWVEAEAKRALGATDNRRIVEATRRTDDALDAFTNDPRVLRIVGEGARAEGSALLQPDLDAVARVYDPLLEDWERAARETVFFPSFAMLRNGAPPAPPETRLESAGRWSPNYLTVQNRTKIHCAFARRAAARKDWPLAFAELEKAAHLGDSARYLNVLGYLIATACRSLAYQTFADLLNADPPEEFERAALAALAALRPTDPAYVRAVDLAERSILFLALAEAGPVRLPNRTRSSAEVPKSLVSNLMLLGAVGSATRLHERLIDPRLAGWAARFRRIHRLDDRADDLAITDLAERQRARWTTRPAAAAWLKRAARTEPAIFEGFPMPTEARAGLDPVTLVMVLSSSDGIDKPAASTRGRVAATQGRLVEAAFAARLYRRERGDWPADFSALSAYLPAAADSRTSSPLAAAIEGQPLTLFEPYRLARLPLDEPLRAAFWGKIFPWAITDCSARRGGKLTPDPDGAKFEQFWTGEFAKWPVVPLALADALAARGALAEVTDVSYKTKLAPGTRGETDWQPLDPEYARRATDETDLVRISGFTNSRGRVIPPDKFGITPGIRRTETPDPSALRIRGRLRAPADALVIWSPGPDGADDGGKICYDPTNGTLSRGDLLVFPEGF